ncbi:aminopeptidase A [Alkalihalobacillus alcalophilus ATCC 27647 = CGMCC 1.3604]|uniref:Probable cytosol aminopeptidase n=1 Tax=Alkalihalobacillus alcalophilus ATCC 27647 = CGMCC 1.3604 TaxID=1218173 RepID=A0A094YQ53_ALKAL|nr:leucyl aminopeptidase [Alkalihalobacillus alcalophilus]KGA95607.1 aminopeptidase [Alkalihalobacillus alcalophilus ATCC 27647 = CGMCC 1.3604]MED1563682.1 leucyl aminopeptidase [Alkalihalobacillus alcalophilus]THG90034.1 aminopeptidase A [Alkalihalobacillus alcalophilus ATCC 27647 = CGMCC 1.3604]
MYQVNRTLSNEQSYDALIVGIHEQEGLHSILQEVDKNLEGKLAELLKAKQLHTKKGELTKVFTFGQANAKVIYTVGLGSKKSFDLDSLQNAIGKVARQVTTDKLANLAIAVDSFQLEGASTEELIHAITESIELAAYKVDTYKEKSNEKPFTIESVTLIGEEADESWDKVAQTGRAFGEGTNLSRKLVNLPGNMLTPTYLAEEAKKVADKHGFEFDVLEREDMEKLGMGALLAVAAGSDQPPKMIVLKYQATEKWEDVVGFVGKGLTFDAGGISLKPGLNMHEMKGDMGGAAAVLGAMDIIGHIKPNKNILAVIPSSENLINGSALKPGDVIRAMSGKTIEVRNTDAEGRLILADGVAYAKQLGANYLVDVATLTGAVLVALGNSTTGVVHNNKEWYAEVEAASEQSREPIWAFPTHKPYHDLLKSSDVADLNNAPGRLGGSITAGLFIGEFAEETPWVHLDVAGTAWTSKTTPIGQPGGTGVMARTLAYLAAK